MTSNTRNTYQSAIDQFISWGGYIPCKPRLVLEYLKDQGAINKEGRLKAKTLQTHLAAISKRHVDAGFIDPTKKPEISSFLKELTTTEQKMHIHADDARYITPEEGWQLIKYLSSIGETKKERRDRLIVALLMMLGHRAGHVAITHTDNIYNLGIQRSNIHLNIRPYKTQHSYKVPVPYTGELFCPATWMRDYIKECRIESGFIFTALQSDTGKPLSRQSINTIAKEKFSEAGIIGGKLSANSFRKTISTISALEGVDSLDIAAHGGWTNVETINRNYLSKVIALKGTVSQALLRSFKKAELALTNDTYGSNKLTIKGQSVELSDYELGDLMEQIRNIQVSSQLPII